MLICLRHLRHAVYLSTARHLFMQTARLNQFLALTYWNNTPAGCLLVSEQLLVHWIIATKRGTKEPIKCTEHLISPNPAASAVHDWSIQQLIGDLRYGQAPSSMDACRLMPGVIGSVCYSATRHVDTSKQSSANCAAVTSLPLQLLMGTTAPAPVSATAGVNTSWPHRALAS